jgi:sugar O-acyltransferase (sialic acid O-acetyltransferase NeuD family)
VPTELVIVGCGGHGREVLGLVVAVNRASATGPPWRPVGFADDRPSAADRTRIDRLGVPYLGPLDTLGGFPAGTHVALGIGLPQVRRLVARQIEGYGLPTASLLHPLSMVGADTVPGEGLLLFAGARVTTNVTLGRHVHVNMNATVAHDCVLGDFVSVNPLAAVSGECRLESGVMIGTTAAVIQRVHIGADATVGAGACVVRDVPPGVVVKGVPAR